MAAMDACSVDAIVTDPPYGLGFMGKGWDRGVPGIEFWQAALRVAKPGAYLLAFGGTRAHHRLMVAIEDAGWEIRDTVMWVYGSGFPKSHNGPWGGTALKPAWEPIVMARKPLIGTVAANVLAHGTGGLNIDGCRVETDENLNGGAYAEGRGARAMTPGGLGERSTKVLVAFAQPAGRWPANLIHDGSDEVLACFPDSKGQCGAVRPDSGTGQKTNGILGKFATNSNHDPRGDTGSAARFFYCAKADRFDRNDGTEGMPMRTAGMVSNTSGQHITRRDGGAPGPRANHHPTVKPTALMRYLCRLVTPKGGTVLDPFAGSGSTLKGAELEGFSAIGIELDAEYCEIARRRIGSDAPLFSDVT